MKTKISKRSVDLLSLDGDDLMLWDSELRGFGVRCRASGAKHYVLKYRNSAGRQRWYTIGRHGSPWTPETARREARRLLGEVAGGLDPAVNSGVARVGMTVSELCDLYLEEGCATKKASTLDTDRSNINRHIRPLLGGLMVGAVTRADVEKLQRDIADGRTVADVRTRPRGRAVVTGGKGVAARVTRLLGTILEFAVKRDVRADNPARGVRLFKGEEKTRFLTPSEFAGLGAALDHARTEGVNSAALAAIELLALTGCRKSEVLALRWEWVDIDRHCLRLPDSKTGAKVVPLGDEAVELLQRLPRIEDNPHVFPGAKPGHHVVGLQKVWNMVRKRAGLADVRLHDLRHSFASVAVSGGASLFLTGKALGHKQSSTTEIYAHLSDAPLHALVTKTAATVANALAADPNRGPTDL
jgi:integrase